MGFTNPFHKDPKSLPPSGGGTYLESTNNLSDVDTAATAFINIKQGATESTTGVIEKATTTECVTGTDTDRAVTPAGLTARMEEPGEIGGTTPAEGNFTDVEISGEVQADVDMAGNYLLQCQNISDLAAKGPAYWFDGVNSQIDISNSANFEFGTGDFSVISNAKVDAGEISSTIIGSYKANVVGQRGFMLTVQNDGILWFDVDAVHVGGINSGISIDDGLNHIIAGIRDGDTGYIYIDGKLVKTETGLATKDATSTGDLNIGGDIVGAQMQGEISRNLLFNMALSASETEEYYNGKQIPFKYLNASQDLIIDSDFTGDLDGWDTSNTWNSQTNPANNMVLAASGVQQVCRTGTLLEVGKRYRITYTATGVVGSPYFGYNSGSYQNAGVISNGTNSIEFTLSKSVNQLLYIISAGATDEMTIDNISIVQIGCVGQYEQPGIGHNQWLDNSGNELHGEVSGAIPINLEANHTEKVIKKTVTGDSLWSGIIPIGYILERMIFEETAGNAAILDLGTSDGANDVFTGVTIAASAITVVEINEMFSSSAVQTLDLNDDQVGSDFNSASIDITFIMQRIQL